MGILYAIGALICWGVGDFLIQRSARKFGDGIALFFIVVIETLTVLPFVWSDIPAMFDVSREGAVLWGASLLILAAALLDFEALRIGKISVVEPVFSFELAVTAGLGAWFLDELLSWAQLAYIAMLIVGIALVSVRRLRLTGRRGLERGVLIAVATTVLMGATNFMFGIGARETSPLIINWFTSAFMAVVMAGYLTVLGEWHHIRRQWRENKPLILSVGIIDNMGWIFFAYSMVAIPVAIATGISELYIVLAALLGMWLNRERLAGHQLAGLVVAVAAAVALALTLG